MISLLQLTMTRQAHKYIFEWSTSSIGSLWMSIKNNPKTVSPKTKQSTDNSVQLNESNKVVWVACLPLLSIYLAQLRRFCESEICTSFAYISVCWPYKRCAIGARAAHLPPISPIFNLILFYFLFILFNIVLVCIIVFGCHVRFDL